MRPTRNFDWELKGNNEHAFRLCPKNVIQLRPSKKLHPKLIIYKLYTLRYLAWIIGGGGGGDGEAELIFRRKNFAFRKVRVN